MRCESKMNGWSCELPADHAGAHVQHGDCCVAEWSSEGLDDAVASFFDDFADSLVPTADGARSWRG
ncbi:hypothetical protein DEI99_005365 [Curtobacterium sp. MCLR17_036]|uniref:hypothetical protein n=1 Tax=Curtobacterium sp. MCLR17_036 TaxID=2175620 RepID=UPI000DA904E2|nr:hypothetical protein [Curtobacterium sp. MCLR17_036]WIE65968.1 hypothetical protein DEI99_005365 [Curtobacterium sp. MCLR17_036]